MRRNVVILCAPLKMILCCVKSPDFVPVPMSEKVVVEYNSVCEVGRLRTAITVLEEHFEELVFSTKRVYEL
jgi:hypothetical protein